MAKKIVVFTPYAPTMGGGAQNLRSALPYLEGIEFEWAYLWHREVEFPNSIYLGPTLIPGPIFPSIWTMARLMMGTDYPPLKALVDKLLAIPCDGYWTVAHYEGCAVAEALRKAGRAVHISVQDDFDALFGRSRRYCMLNGLADKQLGRVLRAVSSVDTTSHPMGVRYAQRYGVKSFAYFPYVAPLPAYTPPPATGPIRIGYAGSLYSAREAKLFAKALEILQQRIGPVEWHLWGLNDRQRSWIARSAIEPVFHPFAPEALLLEDLVKVHALYVMYPFDKKSRIFAQTSHPAKLSTYLKAQRPMLAHTPMPSSLGEFVYQNNLGVVTDTLSPNTLAGLLQTLLSVPPKPEYYVKARDTWYGEANLEQLRQALLNLQHA